MENKTIEYYKKIVADLSNMYQIDIEEAERLLRNAMYIHKNKKNSIQSEK